MNKTDGRKDLGQTAFWANCVRGEKTLGERTAIQEFVGLQPHL